MKNNEFYNASGCPDPTAYEAIRNLHRRDAETRLNRLINELKTTITENGFVLTKRIELRDIKSGIVLSNNK